MPDGAPIDEGVRWKLRRFEAILFALAAGVLIYQLLVPPIVGLADNGDYQWLMQPLGLESTEVEYGERYWSYVNREYRIVPRKWIGLITSELVLAEIALALDRLLTRDRVFDLLFLGGVHVAVYLLGLYLLLLAAGKFRAPSRQVIGVAILVAGTDFGYISTFNSLYSESASLIFLALLVGSTLVGARHRHRASWLAPAFFLFAALFLAAKPQNYPLVLPLLLLLLSLMRRRELRLRPALVIPSIVGLLVLVFYLFTALPMLKRSANLWNVVFCNILPSSASPAEELTALGLDPDLVRWVGVNAWSPDPEPPFEEVASDLGFLKVTGWYARNPGVLVRLASECASQVFLWRDPLFGNFTREAGQPPRSRNRSFTAWSEMENRLFPKSLSFLAAFFFVFLAAAARVLRRHGLQDPTGSTAVLCLVLGSMAILQFAVVVIGEGRIDVIKHLFLFQVLFDLCLIASLAWTADLLTRHGRRALRRGRARSH